MSRDINSKGIKKGTEHTFENRRCTAYHEGGHALIALYTEGAYPLHKATIVHRGNALGVVLSFGYCGLNS